MTNDSRGPQMLPCISEIISPMTVEYGDWHLMVFRGLGITLSNQIRGQAYVHTFSP